MAAMDAKSVLTQVVSALLELWEREPGLAEYNAGELVVAHYLALFMRKRFPDWNVDPEWTKREHELKRLAELPQHGGVSRQIRPDIIVHHRGQQENLLVVELKRHDNRDIAGDVWKLEGMTAQDRGYAYSVGLHLVLNVEKMTVALCDVYAGGGLDADLTAWLRGQLPA